MFKRKNNALGRLQSGLLTFLAATDLRTFFSSFIQALTYAAIALSILALITHSDGDTRQKDRN